MNKLSPPLPPPQMSVSKMVISAPSQAEGRRTEEKTDENNRDEKEEKEIVFPSRSRFNFLRLPQWHEWHLRPNIVCALHLPLLFRDPPAFYIPLPPINIGSQAKRGENSNHLAVRFFWRGER